jgi:hypothetical protein
MSEVTGMGMGSNTHQITHSMVTAAVMARAGLSGLMVKKYTTSANIGPANKVSVFVFIKV